jgi:hypothetical protein
MKVEELALGLVYFEDIIENPKKIIDDIEKLDEELNKPENKWVTTQAKKWGVWTDGDQFFCQQKFLPIPENLNKNDKFYDDLSSITNRLTKPLEIAMDNYFDMYPIAKLNVKRRENSISLLKYGKNGYLPPHSDQGISSRVISVLMYLNDDYEGGKINFPNSNISLKPKAGSIIFFPSNYIYVHSIDEVTDGYRYVLPNWFHNRIDLIDSNGEV